MLSAISQQLFASTPSGTLYHYTSFSGLQGIVDSGLLRASDVRYMNDSAELKHTLDCITEHVTRRILAGVDQPALLNAFLDWLSHRIVSGSLLFGASFRANGNLLSQWRGYSVHGKGVSLGFNASQIAERAQLQGFQIGRCIYDVARQDALIEQVVDAVEQLAAQRSTANVAVWREVFQQVESELLRIAAVLKHPSFEEEQEWRLISPVVADCQQPQVQFREGSSMLIPYYNFALRDNSSDPIGLDRVYLGPTSNVDLSMNSLALYLAKRNASPEQGIEYCDIPYRRR